MPHNSKIERKLKIAQLLASGFSKQAIAEMEGFARSTIHEWAKDPFVVAEVERLKSEHGGMCVNQQRVIPEILRTEKLSAALEALKILKEIARDKEVQPKDRIAAAKTLLELQSKNREEEIEKEIDSLKELINNYN
jgi:transposase